MLKCGSVISTNGKLFRIIETRGCDSVLIELGVERYNFEVVPANYLISVMNAKEVEDPVPRGDEIINSGELEELTKKEAAVQKIIRSLPDITDLASKKTCPEFEEYLREYDVAKSTAHRTIRRYLQSGMDMYSLRDSRKKKKSTERDMFDGKQYGGHLFYDGSSRIPLDPELEKKLFEEGFRMIGRENSLSYIVRVLNRKYFSDVVLDEDGNYMDIVPAPLNACISEKRFRRYCRIRMGTLSLDQYKKDARKRRNDDRIRYGTSDTNCHYPGAVVEIDACELDMIVVGLDRRQDLGRPVVYFVLDAYSRKILAYYIGFENNSFLGATSLFNALFFEYGILPDRIRVDHGAEWVSNEVRRLCGELGISIEIVSPATGSDKGLVENSFHVYQKRIRSSGKEYGAIYKEYGSKHYDKASMMIDELKQDLDAFVEAFNHMQLKNYGLSMDMALKNVRAVPEELWEYGLSYMSSPRCVTDAMRDRVAFALCVPKTKRTEMTLSKKGFMLSGLIYISSDKRVTDLISRNKNGLEVPSYEVRIDPRTVSYIWLRIGAEYMKVPLSEKRDNLLTFSHLTWFEYGLILKDIKDNQYGYREEDRRIRMGLEEQSERIMKQSKKEQKALGGKNSRKNIRPARIEAQQDDRRKNLIGGPAGPEIPAEEQPLLPAPETEDTGDEFRETSYDDYF